MGVQRRGPLGGHVRVDGCHDRGHILRGGVGEAAEYPTAVGGVIARAPEQAQKRVVYFADARRKPAFDRLFGELDVVGDDLFGVQHAVSVQDDAVPVDELIGDVDRSEAPRRVHGIERETKTFYKKMHPLYTDATMPTARRGLRGVLRKRPTDWNVPVEEAPACRLRDELASRDEPCAGMYRADMAARLRELGVSTIDTRSVPRCPANRAEDPSCVFVGHLAGFSETRPNRLVVSNRDTEAPLLGGDFERETLTIHSCLRLGESSVSSDTPGEVGDIRRQGSDLFLYRRVGERSGWYRLAFDYAV